MAFVKGKRLSSQFMIIPAIGVSLIRNVFAIYFAWGPWHCWVTFGKESY